MRLALGLRDGPSHDHPQQQRPDQARPKHRFAKDGEVPVVVLHGRRDQDLGASPRNRLAALEASLQSERAARAHAERALAEAQAHVQSLRTKLAHAELSHREALNAAIATREEAEQALQAALAVRVVVEPPKKQIVKAPRKAAVAQKVREAKPVKWWLPGYGLGARKAIQQG